MTDCLDCGHELEPRKRVENNEVVEDGLYCPECDEEYHEETVLEWDELDFPVWVGLESYNDNWQLWDRFVRQENLHVDVETPDLSDMKYTVFTVWFKVEEDGSITGPYAERGDEETIYE